MKCLSAMSTARDPDAAFQQILQQLDQGLAGDSADLTLIFSSMHHADELGRIASAFLEQARTKHVIGCTGESIVGGFREVEGSPALSVWSINMAGVTIKPLRLGEPGDFENIPAEGIENPERSVVLLLGDPFSFRTDDYLRQVNHEVRGLRVIGGMASGSQVPRGNQLVLDGETFVDGAVAMLLGGPLSITTVVSQGCRPIGRPLIVTRADGNVIHELGRRPALEALRDMF
jgi:small ligand-binding sensory domain FIST